MAIEEKEAQETLLKELIEKVEKDPIPTHIFTTEDTDPLVLLGKLNEIIAKLKDLRALYVSSDAKATQALDNAINALSNATQALQSANTALSTANTAIDTANTALDTANTAIDISNDAVDTATALGNEAKETAETLGTQANTKADNAVNQANEALRVAQEALSQIVEGLGSKVYDISGNLLSNAKFRGDNGINVDMGEDDPETFDIRLDDTITQAIEDNNTLAQNNKSSIESINEDIAGINEDITGIKQAQASDSLAIVELQSKNLTQDEEITNAKNNMTYLAERITATENENTRQNTHIDDIEKFTDLVDVTTSTSGNKTTYTFNMVGGLKFEIVKKLYSSGEYDYTPRLYSYSDTQLKDINMFQYSGGTVKFKDQPLNAWIKSYSLTDKWFKLTNGIMVIWGTAKSASLFTFKQPFKNNDYILLGISDKGDWETLWRMGKTSATQGGLTSRYGNRDIRFFAIGEYA